jgi:hypothetical protein
MSSSKESSSLKVVGFSLPASSSTAGFKDGSTPAGKERPLPQKLKTPPPSAGRKSESLLTSMLTTPKATGRPAGSKSFSFNPSAQPFRPLTAVAQVEEPSGAWSEEEDSDDNCESFNSTMSSFSQPIPIARRPSGRTCSFR